MNVRVVVFYLLPKSLSVVYNANYKLWAFGENITSTLKVILEGE